MNTRFSWFNATSIALGFAFLYLPIVILVIYSFNASRLVTVWGGWSLRWYANYAGSTEWVQATFTSLKAAFLTMLVATPLGTMAAYGLFASRLRWVRPVYVLLVTPIVVPVILVGIGTWIAGLFVLGVWAIYRIARGWLRLNAHQPMPMA